LKVKTKKSFSHKDEFPVAVRYYEDGNIREAQNTLERMLKSNPKDYDVMVFLGGIHLNSGNYEKSVEYFQKVVSIVRQHPTAHYNLGISYHKLNQFEKAEENYRKAIEVNPKNADAYNNLGIVCSALGRKEQALEYYNKVLTFDKTNSKAFNNIGNLYSSLGKHSEAEYYYLQALTREPNDDSYMFNLSDCYIKQNKLAEALAILKKILAIKPGHYQALNSLGVVYIQQKEYQKAKETLEKAISLKNNFWEGYQNLGICYEKLNLNSEAIALYKKALDFNDGNVNAIIQLSNLAMQEGNYTESENYLHQLEKNKNAKVISYTNLGVSKLKQGDIDEAISYTKKALDDENATALTHYNYAHALLLKGNFNEGWKEYEWRKKRDDFEIRTFSKPQLNHQDVKDKKILVYDEQGLGDSIQFVRFLPKLKELGAYVILECSQRLAGIYKNLKGADQIIIKNGTNEPDVDYDFHIALLSLPLFFKTDLSNIPNDIPYLFAEQKLIEKWKTVVDDNYLKVGISWAGNPKNYNDRNRSCRLKDLEKLFSVPKVKFYSLQKGEPVKQIYELGNNSVMDLDTLMDTMDTTAAAIENFDLVISVDTSMAHLAGAMGKPVWVMLPFLPDWRWMLDRDDSPWYPNIKLFRQTVEKDWNSVVEKIRTELISLVQEKYGTEVLSEPLTKSYSSEVKNNGLCLALSKGENFGWGVCSKYLRKELSKRIPVTNAEDLPNGSTTNGNLFHALTDLEFNSITNLRGIRNFGYTFFENELTGKSVANAEKYDIVFGGSTWCKEKMEAKGIKNTGLLIQGVDPEIFYPVEQRKEDNLFIIFSGGKFELRKGQDLVLKAFQVLHKKYPNMILINAWFNYWPASIATMAHSEYINFEMKGNTWTEFMTNILVNNNIDLKKVFTLPITPNDKLRELYSKTDIGLFPNRCEGGTNLVLMEYMACGKPVIASYNSGHKDILTEENSIPLKDMKKFELHSGKQLIADWEEPLLEEIINAIEFAYHNKSKLQSVGKKAGEDLKKFTWEKTADSLLSQIN